MYWSEGVSAGNGARGSSAPSDPAGGVGAVRHNYGLRHLGGLQRRASSTVKPQYSLIAFHVAAQIMVWKIPVALGLVLALPALEPATNGAAMLVVAQLLT